MAHIKTQAVEVKSDTPGGAYLTFHDTTFAGVGVWHLVNIHPQFVHVQKGIVSYLVFDHWDAVFDWMADNVNVGDRVYEVRDRELVDVTGRMLNAAETLCTETVPVT